MGIAQLTFRFETSRLTELSSQGEPLIHILIIRHQRRGIGYAAIVGTPSHALPADLISLGVRSIGTIRRSEVEKSSMDRKHRHPAFGFRHLPERSSE